MAHDEPLFSPARRNVVARFRTRRQARKATDALEAHGFDAGAIRLDGAGPVTVAAGSDDPEKVAHAEEAIRDLDPIDLNRVDEHGEPV
jgi:hypothetical protein